MMHRCVANLLLGIILILVDGTQGAHRLAGDHLPDCDENVSRTCTWHSQQALPEPVIIHGAWRSALGVFPVLIMDGVADNTQQTLPAVKGGSKCCSDTVLSGFRFTADLLSMP